MAGGDIKKRWVLGTRRLFRTLLHLGLLRLRSRSMTYFRFWDLTPNFFLLNVRTKASLLLRLGCDLLTSNA